MAGGYFLTRSLYTNRFLDWMATCAEGALSGIFILWDNRLLQLEGSEESNYTLSCRFKNVDDDFCWVFPGVYGPNDRSKREELWEELGAIRGLWAVGCRKGLQCC